MALSIRNRKTEETVRKLAKLRGVSMTAAIDQAVNRELASEEAIEVAEVERKRRAIQEIQARIAALPVLDPTVNADDWMYDEHGLPH